MPACWRYSTSAWVTARMWDSVKGVVQGAAAVTGGAEGDPLLRAAHVRFVEW